MNQTQSTTAAATTFTSSVPTLASSVTKLPKRAISSLSDVVSSGISDKMVDPPLPAGPPPPLSWRTPATGSRRYLSVRTVPRKPAATSITPIAPNVSNATDKTDISEESQIAPVPSAAPSAALAPPALLVGPAKVEKEEIGVVSFPPWHESQLSCLREAESNVLVVDVESCNPSRGPVRVCAFVLISYRSLLHYEIVDRVQFIVDRGSDEYDEDGRAFWKEKAIGIDRYFDHPTTIRLSPASSAKHIRAYLEHCWATVPKLAILVDEPQTDHALLYEFLKAHGHRPMCYDAQNTYKRNVHVSRDLMRGAFSMIDARFINLEESDMYLYIHRYWQELVQQHTDDAQRVHAQHHHQQQPAFANLTAGSFSNLTAGSFSNLTAGSFSNLTAGSFSTYPHGAHAWHPPPLTMMSGSGSGSGTGSPPTKQPVSSSAVTSPIGDGAPAHGVGVLSTSLCRSAAVLALNDKCIFRTQLGPDMKHVPVFDSSQTGLIWAKMEDIKRLFHGQLIKLAALITLPKPGVHNPSSLNTTAPSNSQTAPFKPQYNGPIYAHSTSANSTANSNANSNAAVTFATTQALHNYYPFHPHPQVIHPTFQVLTHALPDLQNSQDRLR
jgi:hypothetical protein